MYEKPGSMKEVRKLSIFILKKKGVLRGTEHAEHQLEEGGITE